MADIHPEISRLVAQGKLPSAAAAKVSALTPGTYVSSKSWGGGKVVEWDLMGDKVVVDFEGKAGHALKLEFAAKTLEPIPENHVLARRFADRPGLQQLAEKDHPAFVRLVLLSSGKKMSLDAFEDMVKGKVIPEAKFKSWWESAKRALRTKPEFIVPSKRTLPLELRDDGMSPAETLLQDFTKAREMKAKIKALEAILKDVSIFGSGGDLESVVRSAEETASQNLRLKPGDALEILLNRDDLVDRVEFLKDKVQMTLPQAVAVAADKLHEFVGTLGVSKQGRVFGALSKALGGEWIERAFWLINRLNQRSLGELAKVIIKEGESDKLNTYLKTNISQRNLSSEALAWICWERKGVTKPVFSAEITPALMSAVERDHFDDNKKSNRVLDALMDDKDLVADLVTGADATHVNNFARQVMLSPAFEELTKRSLMARIIRVVPEVQELVEEHSGAKDDQNSEILIVSWESLAARKKALKHLVHVEIPQNRKDIEIARSYGDLRENFEFKSSKEYQRVLMRRKMESERDLARAQGTDFADAQSEKVGIGTVVTVRDTVADKEEEYTILGAWDSDPAKHVISYLTAAASAMRDHVVGDIVELTMDDGTTGRTVQITAIRKWEPPPGALHGLDPELAAPLEDVVVDVIADEETAEEPAAEESK